MRACQHHPEEAALGICIVCSAPLCDACTTKLDGINHCRSCLLLRAAEFDPRASAPAADARRAPGKRGAALGWLSFAAGVLLLAALALQTLNAVLPEGSP